MNRVLRKRCVRCCMLQDCCKVLLLVHILMLNHSSLTHASKPPGVNDQLAAGVNIQASDADGMTALHKACLENYLPIVSALVSKGADINVQDNDWWTPLHAAASGGNWRICNMLFSHGADPLAVNAEGDLPFDLVNDTKVEGIIKREMESKGSVTRSARDDVPRFQCALVEGCC